MALDTTIGGTSADSMASLAEYEAYAAALGWTLADTDAANEVNLRRAAQYLDRNYAFIGMKQYQYQTMPWPRLYPGLIEDWPVNPDTIPGAIKDAQCELAFLIQGGLDPFATVTAVVASTRAKAGPVETETVYQGGLSRPRLVALEGILGPYLASGRGQQRLARG